jgi:hypothetical protein
MKRSLLAVAAVLALGSVSAYAETPGFPQPSFNDAPDLTPTRISGTQTVEQQFPKSSYAGGGGPKGPATVLVRGNDRASAQYAHSSAGGATKSDAQDGSGVAPTLNDTFHYPAY